MKRGNFPFKRTNLFAKNLITKRARLNFVVFIHCKDFPVAKNRFLASHHLKGVKGVASFARKRPERGKATVPLLSGGLLLAKSPKC